MESLSRQEVRRIDRCAIETIGAAGVVLMENAGRNCADAIERFSATRELGAPAVAVVAGAGNNGGDGFVIARHLAMRAVTVRTFVVVPDEKIAGDARANLTILRNLEHDVRSLGEQEISTLADSLRGFDLVVDAVGGTGIRGALRGAPAAAVEQINAAGLPVVAVDIPSGLDCDRGQAAGAVVRADLTVTFVARKKGFDAPGAAAWTGPVEVADIGVPPARVAAIADRRPET